MGSLEVRCLEQSDYAKGYLQLLSSLTTVGDVSEAQFSERFRELEARKPDYRIAVIEDTAKSQIIAAATLLIERKFIHQCGSVGHIEDVVVDPGYRGQRLGQRVVADLLQFSKQAGCYKTILDCSDDNVPFYEKCGLTKKEVQMVVYFDR
eukprot:jgi/Tetstr1/450096/TSEL_037141.t1